MSPLRHIISLLHPTHASASSSPSSFPRLPPAPGSLYPLRIIRFPYDSQRYTRRTEQHPPLKVAVFLFSPSLRRSEQEEQQESSSRPSGRNKRTNEAGGGGGGADGKASRSGAMRRSHVAGFLFWIFCERAWSEARRAGRQARARRGRAGAGGKFGGLFFHRGPGGCFLRPRPMSGAHVGGARGCFTERPGTVGGGEMCASGEGETGEGEKAWGCGGGLPLGGRVGQRAASARVAVVARRLV